MKNTEEPHIEQTFHAELDKKLWVTKGARFNAYRRLKCRHDWSLAAISFLSVYVIIFTLIQYFPAISLNSEQKDVIAFTAIALSMFIVVLTLLEASKNYQVKAERLHSCAKEISGLYAKLQFVRRSAVPPVEQPPELERISSEYTNIISGYQENHEPIDYHLFRAQNHSDFPLKLPSRTLIHLRAMACSYLPYLLLLIVAPPILFAIILNALSS